MSWKASAWAKEQRLGSPSAKSILMCLADYADPEGLIKGWASQADLSASAEVSERTAREWLQRLEDWGLLERRHQQKPNGARAADWIVLRLDRTVTDGSERCRAMKDGDETEGLPAEIAGRTNRQPDADPTGNEAHPTGNQFRAYKEEPPLEPPLPSHQERAGAREREVDREDRKKAEAAYWRMVRVWPKLSGMPKDGGIKAFLAMSPEDRDTAERRFAGWLDLLKAQGKDHVPAPSTYFGKRLFDDVPEPAERGPEPVTAKPFGKAFGAFRMAKLVAGREPDAPIPALTETMRRMVEQGVADETALMREQVRRYGFRAVNRLHAAAAEGRCVTLAPCWHELGELTEAVRVGSALWDEWKAFHEAKGWPWLPDVGRVEWVYFPAGGPAGLSAFEHAVSMAKNEREAAA